MSAVATWVLPLVLLLQGCVATRMYVEPVDLERLDDPATKPRAVSVSLQPVPRMESSLYQDAFERELERVLQHANLFEQVTLGGSDPDETDLIIEVGRANLSSRAQINLAYFPLALATATLYIWFGGPIATHVEFYDVDLQVTSGSGARLFHISASERETHWLGIYHEENYGEVCRAPGSRKFLAQIVEKIERELDRMALP